MLEYLDVATKTTISQVFDGLVMIFLIALVLHKVGNKLRHLLSSKLGNFYDYLMVPGIACHEVGRTLGCWLTGTRTGKLEIFGLNNDDAERIPIAVSVNQRFAFLKRFVILTVPIWLGCGIICIMTTLAAGIGFLPSYSESFKGCAEPGLICYVTTLITEATSMVVSLLFVWHWSSPFCLVVFYLLFCIGSQITMSGKSFLLIWQSILGVFVILFVLNLIPGVNSGIAWLGDKLMPAVFVLHVVLLFVVLLNFLFLMVAGVLLKWKRGTPRRSDGGSHRRVRIFWR